MNYYLFNEENIIKNIKEKEEKNMYWYEKIYLWYVYYKYKILFSLFIILILLFVIDYNINKTKFKYRIIRGGDGEDALPSVPASTSTGSVPVTTTGVTNNEEAKKKSNFQKFKSGLGKVTWGVGRGIGRGTKGLKNIIINTPSYIANDNILTSIFIYILKILWKYKVMIIIAGLFLISGFTLTILPLILLYLIIKQTLDIYRKRITLDK